MDQILSQLGDLLVALWSDPAINQAVGLWGKVGASAVGALMAAWSTFKAGKTAYALTGAALARAIAIVRARLDVGQLATDVLAAIEAATSVQPRKAKDGSEVIGQVLDTVLGPAIHYAASGRVAVLYGDDDVLPDMPPRGRKKVARAVQRRIAKVLEGDRRFLLGALTASVHDRVNALLPKRA